MGQTLIPAKAALRVVLLARAPRLGLTTAALDVLVERAELSWPKAAVDVTPPPGRDVATFVVVCGAVAVGWCGRRGASVAVQIAGPGQFVGAGWAAGVDRAFRARTLAPSVLAALDREALAAALELLPPARRLQVVTGAWRSLARLLADSAEALCRPLETRLVTALERLAGTFGVPHPAGGREIRLKLHVVDLAPLVTATRPNVSRRFAALRRAGRVRDVDGLWVVADCTGGRRGPS